MGLLVIAALVLGFFIYNGDIKLFEESDSTGVNDDYSGMTTSYPVKTMPKDEPLFKYYNPDLDVFHECPNCGADVRDDQECCYSCGFRLSVLSDPNSFTDSQQDMAKKKIEGKYLSGDPDIYTIELFKQAAKCNISTAIHALAGYYDAHKYQDSSLKKLAAEYLFTSAKLGNAYSLSEVGNMLECGNYFAKDEKKALTFYAKAWAHGYDSGYDHVSSILRGWEYEKYIKFHEKEALKGYGPSIKIVENHNKKSNNENTQPKSIPWIDEALNAPPTGDYFRTDEFGDRAYCTNSDISVCLSCVHRKKRFDGGYRCVRYGNSIQRA